MCSSVYMTPRNYPVRLKLQNTFIVISMLMSCVANEPAIDILCKGSSNTKLQGSKQAKGHFEKLVCCSRRVA